MPNNIPDCKKQELSRFDSMSEEELRTFLRLDASKPEGEASDMEEVLYVMELLSVRRKERGESRDPYKAFEEFKKYYAPEGSFPDAAPVKAAIPFRWQRVAVIAAVLALLIGATATVGAAKFDLREIIAKWTKETFYLGEAGKNLSKEEEPSITSIFPYTDLQTILYEKGIYKRIVPTWIPEGFEQKNFSIVELAQGKIYNMCHCRGDAELSFEVNERKEDALLQIERSGTILEVYSLCGIDYYILDNNGQMHVVWKNDCFECVLSGNISLEEAKQMIDSIEKD